MFELFIWCRWTDRQQTFKEEISFCGDPRRICPHKKTSNFVYKKICLSGSLFKGTPVSQY